MTELSFPTVEHEEAHGPVRRVRVVLNRGGRVVERGPDTVQAEITSAFRDAGVDAEVRLVPGQDLVRTLTEARDAARAGSIDAAVVGGGDGSVSCAAGLFAGTEATLAVLPLGTLNHFAKDLGMPLDLGDAVRAVTTGERRTVDVAEVNGHVFVNNSVIGVYPYMVSDRERRRRLHRLGKWVAMTLAFFRMLGRFPRRRLTLEIGDEGVNYRTPLLFVGVNEYRLDMLEVRRTRGMDRGELWLLVAKHQKSLQFLRFALKAAFGGLRQEGNFDLRRGGEAVVRTRASRIPVACDGEVVRMTSPLAFRLRPRALTVIAPPTSAASPSYPS